MGSMSSKQSRVDKRSKTMHRDIPEEIIEEILLCNLPVKTLLRFKCVSKQWRSLISSKHFVGRHLAKNSSSLDHRKLVVLHPDLPNRSFRSCSLQSLQENSNITSFDHHPLDDLIPLIRSPYDDAEYNNFRMYFNPAPHYCMTTSADGGDDDKEYGRYYPRAGSFQFGILGSCNGLILISVDKGNLFLWNPTTRQAKKIASPESYGFTDAWDFRSGYFIYGFGYDDSTDDYKIVCVFVLGRRKQRRTTTEIYSWRTNTWKKIENFEKGVLVRCNYELGMFTKGKFVNGKLHWLTSPYKEDVYDEDEYLNNWEIVGFDLAEEKYEIVGRPQYLSSHNHCQPRLHELGGHLSLTCFNEENGMDVWVMTKYGETESWVKFWTCRRGEMRIGACPLWLTVENGDIEMCFPVPTGMRVFFCKGGSSRVSHMSRVDIVDPTHFNFHFEANVYVESLVSPFGGGGDDEQQLSDQAKDNTTS